MFFSSSFIMRYPNCVSQFLSIQHDRYTKNNLEMIKKKKTWRVMELVHWTNSSYIPLMGFEQTGHSWKCHRHLPLRCRAAPGRSAPLLGRRRGLGLRTGHEQQKRQKHPGEVDFTHEKWGISVGIWRSDCDLTNKKGGFHHEKEGFDLATIENSLKNRISPSTIKI